MEQLFLKKLFSRTCTFRGKNDVQLTFDDSYICYASKFAVFQSSFLLVFTNGKLLLKKFFSRTCTFREKNDVHLTFDDSYICYVSQFDVF